MSMESPENNSGGPKSNLEDCSLSLPLDSLSLIFSTSISPNKAACRSERKEQMKNRVKSLQC